MRPTGAWVLDTHIWIWLISGDERLSLSLREALGPAGSRPAMLIPAIAVWEIAMLARKGRLTFTLPLADWVDCALAAPGVSLYPLTPEIALESAQLPGDFHGDPADRLIVATTRVLNATLVTRDERILAYGAAGRVSVLAG